MLTLVQFLYFTESFGFPQHVSIRVVAWPGAMLNFISEKAPVIFEYASHILIINLGSYDLLHCSNDPLIVGDRFWHALGLILTTLPISPMVIFVGQSTALVGHWRVRSLWLRFPLL